MPSPLDTLSAIKTRRTIKTFSTTPLPVKPADSALIETLIESAYWAPFHYLAHQSHKETLSSDLPFRFYVLDSSHCRELVGKLIEQSVEASKLFEMLNSADYLIQATWTPQPSDNEALFAPSVVNMEHIAAAGAAIQNLLLTATALGHENYWGSGSVLREDIAFNLLDIPRTEILLGALFLFPSQEELPSDTVVKLSSNREKRGTISDCYCWVKW